MVESLAKGTAVVVLESSSFGSQAMVGWILMEVLRVIWQPLPNNAVLICVHIASDRSSKRCMGNKAMGKNESRRELGSQATQTAEASRSDVEIMNKKRCGAS